MNDEFKIVYIWYLLKNKNTMVPLLERIANPYEIMFQWDWFKAFRKKYTA